MTQPLSSITPAALDVAGAPGADTRRLATKENLAKAGQQFEAVFTRMMLKSMRQPHLAEDLFSSKALDTFREMQDAQLADTMAAARPMGIGKAMTDFLAKSKSDLSETS